MCSFGEGKGDMEGGGGVKKGEGKVGEKREEGRKGANGGKVFLF